MPDSEPKFEHTALEQDIERLSAALKERTPAEKSREVLKTVIKEQMLPPADIKPPASVTPSPLPGYLQQAPNDVKLVIEKLLDKAWHKGIAAAVKEARRHNPLILDAFHDALTDKLYSEFKKRGIL